MAPTQRGGRLCFSGGKFKLVGNCTNFLYGASYVGAVLDDVLDVDIVRDAVLHDVVPRSEERRVGKEC